MADKQLPANTGYTFASECYVLQQCISAPGPLYVDGTVVVVVAFLFYSLSSWRCVYYLQQVGERETQRRLMSNLLLIRTFQCHFSYTRMIRIVFGNTVRSFCEVSR